jgi:hypothetical protein
MAPVNGSVTAVDPRYIGVYDAAQTLKGAN